MKLDVELRDAKAFGNSLKSHFEENNASKSYFARLSEFDTQFLGNFLSSTKRKLTFSKLWNDKEFRGKYIVYCADEDQEFLHDYFNALDVWAASNPEALELIRKKHLKSMWNELRHAHYPERNQIVDCYSSISLDSYIEDCVVRSVIHFRNPHFPANNDVISSDQTLEGFFESAKILLESVELSEHEAEMFRGRISKGQIESTLSTLSELSKITTVLIEQFQSFIHESSSSETE